MRALKWVAWLVVSGALAAAGFWYFNRPGKDTPQYRTTTVTRGPLTQAVTATGQLNPVVNVQVGSQVSGIIQQLFVDYNSPVTNGQVVAQLDAATFRANVLQAEGELANARAGLELAQVNARRAQELRKNELISQSDYDTTIAGLHQAEASVKIREATLEKAKVDYARTTIYAPVDGIVIARNVDVGQTVAASLSAPVLFLIANDLAKMQIDANVSEADVGGVEVGQEVTFTVDAFPYRTFRGKVVQIRNAPITVQNVVSYDTVIEVRNPDLKLKPGMTANVSIVIAQRESVLKIPNAALRFRPPETPQKSAVAGSPTNAPATTGLAEAGASGERRRGGGRGGNRADGGSRTRGEAQISRTIYMLSRTNGAASTKSPGELKPVTVKTGISDGAVTEILEGLQEGDEIIVGLNVAETSPSQRPTSSPFGGGFRRF